MWTVRVDGGAGGCVGVVWGAGVVVRVEEGRDWEDGGRDAPFVVG